MSNKRRISDAQFSRWLDKKWAGTSDAEKMLISLLAGMSIVAVPCCFLLYLMAVHG